MANDPKQPQQNPAQREAGGGEREQERRDEARPERTDEGREGTPGYGQPPSEVREKTLPDQKW